jgi:hypothetical protein
MMCFWTFSLGHGSEGWCWKGVCEGGRFVALARVVAWECRGNGLGAITCRNVGCVTQYLGVAYP